MGPARDAYTGGSNQLAVKHVQTMRMAAGTLQTTQLQSLLNRLKRGDDEARAELINHSCDRLRRHARSMLRKSFPHVGRWEQTDDVLNRALMRLYGSLADVQPDCPARLFALAAKQIRRELIDLARHYNGPLGLGAHHATDGPAAESDERPRYEAVDETYEPASIAGWGEFHEQVEKLPDEQREVFSLRWYQGLTFVEIGEALGIADRTAKRRWRVACVSLHQAMDGQRPDHR